MQYDTGPLGGDISLLWPTRGVELSPECLMPAGVLNLMSKNKTFAVIYVPLQFCHPSNINDVHFERKFMGAIFDMIQMRIE